MSYKNEGSFTTSAYGCHSSVMPNWVNCFFSSPLHLSCVECRKCKACSETPQYGLVNSFITLKDGNKGTGIICCHTPILINNSILDCAISPVEIGICLKAMMAHRIWLTASQLRPIRASSMNGKHVEKRELFINKWHTRIKYIWLTAKLYFVKVIQ